MHWNKDICNAELDWSKHMQMRMARTGQQGYTWASNAMHRNVLNDNWKSLLRYRIAVCIQLSTIDFIKWQTFNYFKLLYINKLCRHTTSNIGNTYLATAIKQRILSSVAVCKYRRKFVGWLHGDRNFHLQEFHVRERHLGSTSHLSLHCHVQVVTLNVFKGSYMNVCNTQKIFH